MTDICKSSSWFELCQGYHMCSYGTYNYKQTWLAGFQVADGVNGWGSKYK